MESVQLVNTDHNYILQKDAKCPCCYNETIIQWRALNFRKCSSCELLFRYPYPEEEDLVKLYQDSWKDPLENTSETGGTSPDLADVYVSKLASSLNLKDFDGLKILDFGAGRGATMAALSELGADVYGVEPFGYENLQNQGFKIFRTLEEIPNNLTFDGIVTRDVIEHLRTPWFEIQKFNDLLVENGFIYIATPNADSLRAKIHGEKWREAVKAGHVVLFTPYCLETVLDLSGYKGYERLKWFIQYSKNPLRNILQYALQTFHIDGELHYLVRKS